MTLPSAPSSFSAAYSKCLPYIEKYVWNICPSCLLSSCISEESVTKFTWGSKEMARFAEPWKIYMRPALLVCSAVQGQKNCCHWLHFYEFSLKKVIVGHPRTQVLFVKTNGSKFSCFSNSLQLQQLIQRLCQEDIIAWARITRSST